MKTLQNVKDELLVARKLSEQELSKKEKSKLEKELKHLYACQLYLESDPTQTFLEKQQKDLKHKIKIVTSGFSTWCSNNPKERDSCKNPKSKYNTMMGLKNFKEQLRTIEYLLA